MSGWISTDSTRQPSTSSRLTLDSLESCKEETRELDIFSTLSSIPVKYDGIEKLIWLWSMSILLHIRKRYAYVSSLLAAEQRKSTSSKRWLTRRNTSSWRWNGFARDRCQFELCRWLGRTRMRSTSEWSKPPRWGSSRRATVREWVEDVDWNYCNLKHVDSLIIVVAFTRWGCLSPACGFSLTGGASTTMKLPRPSRWNRFGENFIHQTNV